MIKNTPNTKSIFSQNADLADLYRIEHPKAKFLFDRVYRQSKSKHSAQNSFQLKLLRAHQANNVMKNNKEIDQNTDEFSQLYGLVDSEKFILKDSFENFNNFRELNTLGELTDNDKQYKSARIFNTIGVKKSRLSKTKRQNKDPEKNQQQQFFTIQYHPPQLFPSRKNTLRKKCKMPQKKPSSSALYLKNRGYIHAKMVNIIAKTNKNESKFINQSIRSLSTKFIDKINLSAQRISNRQDKQAIQGKKMILYQ